MEEFKEWSNDPLPERESIFFILTFSLSLSIYLAIIKNIKKNISNYRELNFKES